MIVWLNGPFGVGKTAVAEALLDAKPEWSLFDPEKRGVELLRTAPDVDDFQDLPAWRTSFVEDALARNGSADLVIPMTVRRLDYYREILDGMKSVTEVRPIRLTASDLTLRARIVGDEAQPPPTVAWRLRHLDACVHAFDDPVFGDHIGTDGRTPAKIAALILVMIGRA